MGAPEVVPSKPGRDRGGVETFSAVPSTSSGVVAATGVAVPCDRDSNLVSTFE